MPVLSLAAEEVASGFAELQHGWREAQVGLNHCDMALNTCAAQSGGGGGCKADSQSCSTDGAEQIVDTMIGFHSAVSLAAAAGGGGCKSGSAELHCECGVWYQITAMAAMNTRLLKPGGVSRLQPDRRAAARMESVAQITAIR